MDKELTAPYGGTELSAGDELHLYGRNRCTVRIDYAEGSLRPEEGAVYRGAASDSASEVIDALSLPDFSRGVEAHVIDGLSLPALGTTVLVTRRSTGVSAWRLLSPAEFTRSSRTAPGDAMSPSAG